MHKACRILNNANFDSVVLMSAAARVKARDGVEEAAFFMGTPLNKRLLATVGLATAQVEAAARATRCSVSPPTMRPTPTQRSTRRSPL